MNEWQPTHISKVDGTPARVVSVDESKNLIVLDNEDGHVWPDFIDDWQPIRREQPTEGVLNISTYEAERWRQLSDELVGQVDRLRSLCAGGTRGDWQAIEAISAAQRSLFGAFAAVMRERQDGN